MTQGRDGISLARARAMNLMGVARHISFVAAVFLIAALVAGSAGTSYAKNELIDTVVVSNYGASFAGTLETFVAGSLNNSQPFKKVTGTNTLLSGTSTGPGGDAQSSLSGQIAVTMPLQLLPATPFLNGWVEIFSAGANGNSNPDAVIASLTGLGLPDYTGLLLPGGVAFRNPYTCTSDQMDDLIAVSNYSVAVIQPNLGIPGLGLCAPNAPGFSVGTITEYNTTGPVETGPGVGAQDDCSVTLPGLTPYSSGFNGVNDICPYNNSPVNFGTQNATIGGCDTYLLGPLGAAFDWDGYLYVVNEIGAYVTVYRPGASGDAIPAAIVGTGFLKDPQFITISFTSNPLDPADDVMLVTDAGDNSIKVFQTFTNCLATPPFICFGTFLGEVSGGATKLKRPEGIATDLGTNTFVVNENGNSLSEYADLGSTCCGDIAPTFQLAGKIGGKGPKMNEPIGLAMPEFSLGECSEFATTTTSATPNFSAK